MKKVLYLCCVLGLMACNSKKPETAATYAATPTGLEGIKNSAPNTAVATSSSTPGAVNPPHGRPGHRCDIAVGAPLNNTTPSTPVTPITGQQVVNIPVETPTTATPVEPVANTTGQKLNPKHGEPGHRCEIAVGAPLDSKPQATAAPKPVEVKLPANLPKEAKNGAKLNPKHGEPGHRCEIAVGAPLT